MRLPTTPVPSPGSALALLGVSRGLMEWKWGGGGDENIDLMQMLLLLYLPLGKANWEFVVVVYDVLVW